MLELDKAVAFFWKIDEGVTWRAARDYKNCKDKRRSRRRWLVEVIGRCCVVVFFTLTDRASTIPSNTRGCQSGTWSAGQKKIRGTSTKLQREQKKNTNTQKTTKRKEQE